MSGFIRIKLRSFTPKLTIITPSSDTESRPLSVERRKKKQKQGRIKAFIKVIKLEKKN